MENLVFTKRFEGRFYVTFENFDGLFVSINDIYTCSVIEYRTYRVSDNKTGGKFLLMTKIIAFDFMGTDFKDIFGSGRNNEVFGLRYYGVCIATLRVTGSAHTKNFFAVNRITDFIVNLFQWVFYNRLSWD